MSHGVEEELEVPDDSGEGGEEVVCGEGGWGDAIVGAGVERIEVDEGVAGDLGGAHGIEAGFADELADGAVFDDEYGGPDEVGEEASPEYDDEDGEVLPEVEATVGEEFGFGEVSDGCSGLEAEGEEGAHDAGEDGDGDAFAKGEVGLSCFGFFFGGDFIFLGPSGGTVDRDGDEADEYAKEDDAAGGLVEDGVDGAIVDGGDEGSEGGAEAEGDGVTEGDAEVADGKAEGEAADSPEGSPEECVEDAGGVGAVGGVEDGEEMGDEDIGEEGGSDEPRGDALDEPVDLPRPTLDATEGDEVGGGGETADPVKDDADEWIWSHEGLDVVNDGGISVAGTIVPDGVCVGEYTLY